MANSALQPKSPFCDLTSQTASQFTLKPPPVPMLNRRIMLPPSPPPVIWASYSIPAGFVPKRYPVWKSLNVSIINEKLSELLRGESRRVSDMTISPGLVS